MSNKPIVAICYDFDGTLSPGNMQENSFLPDLGISPKEFWTEVKKLAKENDMDEILAYMFLMVRKADIKGQPIDKKAFVQHGASLTFFPGVKDWFDRINEYGKARKITVEHYIISSGLREMIEGCSIYRKLKYVYASGFYYDQHGVAKWPALTVNYTTKTQYLFRINKGIPNSWDNAKINQYVPNHDRRVPFANILYIGDGDTDIPAMKMVKHQGGTAIAVYPEKVGKRITPKETQKKKNALKLLIEERADFVASANYCEGSILDKIVKNQIDIIALKIESTTLGRLS